MATTRPDPGQAERSRSRPIGGRSSKRRQVLTFAAIATVCGLLDFGIYQTLRALGMDTGVLIDLARATSFFFGTTLAYLLNKSLTFDGAGGLKQIGSFSLVYGVAFFAVVVLNRLMLQLLPEIPGETSIAWLGSQGAVSLVNFVLLKFVVFRQTGRARRATVDLEPASNTR